MPAQVPKRLFTVSDVLVGVYGPPVQSGYAEQLRIESGGRLVCGGLPVAEVAADDILR